MMSFIDKDSDWVFFPRARAKAKGKAKGKDDGKVTSSKGKEEGKGKQEGKGQGKDEGPGAFQRESAAQAYAEGLMGPRD